MQEIALGANAVAMPALIVLHYHFRPGGVRSVIERTLPLLPAALSRFGIGKIVLAGGSGMNPAELAGWQARHPEIELASEAVEEFAYLSEQSPRPGSGMDDRIAAAAAGLIRKHAASVVWAHNFSVGRNPFLGRGWHRAAADAGVLLWCQHHDWWPEFRWERWQEMQEWGINTLTMAADGTVPEGLGVRHSCVHPRDAALLQRRCGDRAVWLPNPSTGVAPAAPPEIAAAKAALCPDNQPLWLAPCRILRRKNLLEALILAKALQPDCRFAIFGEASSPTETGYAQAVAEAARLLGVNLVANAATARPAAALLAAADMLLQTSLLEGFGLTALDAADHANPLLLRGLPEVTPAMQERLVELPTCYSDLALPAGRRTRPRPLLTCEKNPLPGPWQELAGGFADGTRFGGLTLTEQLNALPCSRDEVTAFLDANPWLHCWKQRLANGGLPPVRRLISRADEESAWIATADRLLTAPAGSISDSGTLLDDIARSVLPGAGLHPLLLGA